MQEEPAPAEGAADAAAPAPEFAPKAAEEESGGFLDNFDPTQ